MRTRKQQPTEYPTWAAVEIEKSEFRDELDLVLGMVQPEYLHDAMTHLGLAVRAANTCSEVCDEMKESADNGEKLIDGLRSLVTLLHGHLSRLNETANDDLVTYDLRKTAYITDAWHPEAMLDKMADLDLIC